MTGKDERERLAVVEYLERCAGISEEPRLTPAQWSLVLAALREREPREEPLVECLECRQKYHPDQCREIMCEECYLAAEPQPEREPDRVWEQRWRTMAFAAALDRVSSDPARADRGARLMGLMLEVQQKHPLGTPPQDPEATP